VRADEQGHDSRAESAEQFSVSTSFVKKRLRPCRATGDLAPVPHGGGQPTSLSAGLRQQVRGTVGEQSDLRRAELPDFLLTAQHTSGHPATSSRALQRLGWPRPKRAASPARAIPTSGRGCGGAGVD